MLIRNKSNGLEVKTRMGWTRAIAEQTQRHSNETLSRTKWKKTEGIFGFWAIVHTSLICAINIKGTRMRLSMKIFKRKSTVGSSDPGDILRRAMCTRSKQSLITLRLLTRCAGQITSLDIQQRLEGDSMNLWKLSV